MIALVLKGAIIGRPNTSGSVVRSPPVIFVTGRLLYSFCRQLRQTKINILFLLNLGL